MSHSLGSQNQKDIAGWLAYEFLNRIKEDSQSPYNHLVPILTEALDEVWPDTTIDKGSIWSNVKERHGKFKHLLAGLQTDEDRILFMEMFAKLGHIHEISALLARQNFFATKDEIRDRRPVKAGNTDEQSTEYYIDHNFSSVQEAVEQLNKPVFEATFTAHPTNNNTLTLTNAVRALGKASTTLVERESAERPNGRQGIISHEEALMTADATFKKAMADFIAAPLVPINEKGEDINLTVRDETEQMLTSMHNIYEDLGEVYRYFDHTLYDKAAKTNTSYDPLSLKLGIRLRSWGSSGDKDGNKNVNADTTLEAAYMHTIAAVSSYSEDMQKLNIPELQGWEAILKKLQAKLILTQDNIAHYRERKLPLPEATFDEYSATLAQLTPDIKALQIVVENVYRDMQPTNKEQAQKKDDLLLFVRRMHTFGPHMGKLEYRETSEEFGRIIGLIDPEYKKLIDENKVLLEKLDEHKQRISKGEVGTLTEEEIDSLHARRNEIEGERSRRMTALLQSGHAYEMLGKIRGHIVAEGQGHNFDAGGNPYAKDEAIAYHTIKRLELIRENPGLACNHVLAECQGLSNKLELQFLMEALSTPAKKLTMGIIPLYEDPDVMQKIKQIEKKSYSNPEYRRHLQEVAVTHPEEAMNGEPTQQIQLAHSDNRRRGGPSAAVGFIDQGHRDARSAGAEAEPPVHVRFYEGGSLSDAFRNGVRAVSAMVNEFGLAQYTKQTFQGIDLYNYFSLPHSTHRLFSRGITHGAKHYDDPVPNIDIDNDPINYLAVKTLQGTLGDYETNVFQTDRIGIILAGTGFGGNQELAGGNVGSRGQRDTSKIFADISAPTVEPSHRFAIMPHTVQLGGFIRVKAVNPDKIRTINFSEILAQAGVNPTWLGTRTIEENVQKYVDETLQRLETKQGHLTPNEKQLQILLRDEKEKDNKGRPSAKLMHFLYSHSAAFKEVIDRMAFGICMSNLDALDALYPQLAATEEMGRLKQEYVKAGQTVLDAMSGGHHSIDHHMSRIFNSEMAEHDIPDSEVNKVRAAVAHSEAMQRLELTFMRKRNYLEFLNFFKADWKEKHPEEINAPTHLVRITHDAMDTALYGRIPLADDPRYADLQSSLPRGRRGYMALPAHGEGMER